MKRWIGVATVSSCLLMASLVSGCADTKLGTEDSLDTAQNDQRSTDVSADNTADTDPREDLQPEPDDRDGGLTDMADDRGEGQVEPDATDVEASDQQVPECLNSACCVDGKWVSPGESCSAGQGAPGCALYTCSQDHMCDLSGVSVGFCLVDETCFSDGEVNPQNDCFFCDASLEALGWTAKADGEACGDGSDTGCDNPDTCDQEGVCQPNHEPTSWNCDDGQECTFGDHCDLEGACTGNTYQCVPNAHCDGLGGCPCNDGWAWGESCLNWALTAGGPDSDWVMGGAVDPLGNLVTTGGFVGVVDFGVGPMVSAGGDDAWLVKHNSTGALLWAKTFGSSGRDIGMSVATDGDGNVVLAGDFTSVVDFGGGPLVSAGSTDVFLAKFDSSGNHLWSKRVGSVSVDEAVSVAVDSQNNIFLAGWFSGSIDLGGGTLVSLGGTNGFVAKLNSQGTHLWSKSFACAMDDRPIAIAVSPLGEPYVTGSFASSIDLGGGPLMAMGGSDVYLVKFSSSGDHLWSKRFGGAGADQGNSVAVDGLGHVRIAGLFSGTADFGGGPLQSAGGWDGFVAGFDADGNALWSRSFGAANEDEAFSVTLVADGNTYVTGAFTGTVSFGGAPLTSVGSSDVFLVKYDSTGGHLSSRSLGSSEEDMGFFVVGGLGTDLFWLGEFSGAVDFGGGALNSAGKLDVFFVRLDQ